MRILVISAHPDDETLGCGGTLLKHRAAGDALFWMVTTEAYEPKWSAEAIRAKAREVEAVAKAYGVAAVHALGFPTARLDTVPQAELIERMQRVVAEVKPEVIYCVHEGDVHTDHRAVFAAISSVLKPMHMARYGVRRLLSYETLSSTDAAPPLEDRMFRPAVFSDVTSQIERKLEIMALYQTERQPYPMPRAQESIRALARYRGATIGIEYAEALMLCREIL